MEQIRKFWNKISEFWKKLDKKIKIIIISVIAILLVTLIAFSVLSSQTDYITLFSGLESNELTEVLTKLQEKNVDYKYDSSGQVLVPSQQETTLRMQLALEGYPKTGLNYDVFTKNIDFMATDFEKKKYAIFQLQERIQATIKTIPGVKDVEVTFSIPEDDNFSWDENAKEPTGHVKINMYVGYVLNKSQVDGILKLVEKSVSGLKPENIAIIDTNGNLLNTDNDDMYQTDTLKLKLQVERSLESELEKKIRLFLEAPYGDENVEVMAKCTFNLDQKITENLKYIPSDENNTGVISDRTDNTEIVGEGEATGGVVGEDTNAEIPSYPNVKVSGDNIYYKDSGTINYLVSQIKEQVQHEPGYLESVMISVIVNKEAMSENEIATMRQLVANAAGTEPVNVAFSYYKFYKPIVEIFNNEGNFLGLTDEQMTYVIIGAAALVLLLIIIIIVIVRVKKKKKKKAEAAALEVLESNSVINADGEEEIMPDEIKVTETKSMALKKQIGEFTGTNPDIAAMLIRTWLKGEDD